MQGSGDSGDELVDIGWPYYQKRDYQRAIQALRNALSTTQRPALAQYRLGFCFRAIKQHDEAINHFREAARLDQRDAWPAFQVGKEFAIWQQFKAALPEFARAIDRNYLFADAYHDGAACLATLGHFEIALSCYTVCAAATQITVDSKVYTSVTASMLETAMYTLAGILGERRYHEIRAQAFRQLGVMTYPIIGDELSVEGFKTISREMAKSMRTLGVDEQDLRRLLGL